MVVIEAKFGADLKSTQVRAYLDDQANRLAAREGLPAVERGVFVMLVPRGRTAEARLAIEHAYEERVAQCQAPYPIEAVVVTWNDLLDSLGTAVNLADQGPDSLAADLAQLRSLCTSLGGLVAVPLGEAASGAAWRTREDVFALLADEVTRRLISSRRGRYPIGNDGHFSSRRYVPSGYVTPDGETCYAAIGVRSDLADEGLPPLWLRFHKVTPGFERVRDLIVGSLGDVRRDGGHVRVPLPVDGE